MLILGIDPGYDRLGLAVIQKLPHQKETLLESCCVTSAKQDEFSRRLATLGEPIISILNRLPIDGIAIENLFVTKNQKTATRVAEVRGMILYLAGRKKIPVIEFTPPAIKLAVTGFGRADKKQVTAMAQKLLDIPPETKRLDDEFDAMVIALAGLAHASTWLK